MDHIRITSFLNLGTPDNVNPSALYYEKHSIIYPGVNKLSIHGGAMKSYRTSG